MTAKEFVNKKLGDKNYTHSPYTMYREEIEKWLIEYEQQVKNLNIPAVIKCEGIKHRRLLINFYKWQYENDEKLKNFIPYEKDVDEFLKPKFDLINKTKK